MIGFREDATHQASQCEAPSWGWSPWSLCRSTHIISSQLNVLSNLELFVFSTGSNVGIELQLLTMAAVTELVVRQEEELMGGVLALVVVVVVFPLHEIVTYKPHCGSPPRAVTLTSRA